MLFQPNALFKHLRKLVETPKMAKSKYEYVRNFESEDKLLPNCWIVVRIDGRAFHHFSKKHKFEKPNDERALNLMNKAACSVMYEFKDVVLAYGQSDEYSFVLRKDSTLYNRRGTKIMTYLCSLFTSSYVFHWNQYFINTKLKFPPVFDSRIVLYPTDKNLRDYLSWRQADCHINNLYNTTFWALILQGGLTNTQADEKLSGTVSADKHEILFNKFDINYNDEPLMYKRGTILLWKKIRSPKHGKPRLVILPLHEKMMHDAFWEKHPEILDIKKVRKGEKNAEALDVRGAKFYDWPECTPLPALVLSQLRLDVPIREVETDVPLGERIDFGMECHYPDVPDKDGEVDVTEDNSIDVPDTDEEVVTVTENKCIDVPDKNKEVVVTENKCIDVPDKNKEVVVAENKCIDVPDKDKEVVVTENKCIDVPDKNKEVL